MEEPVTGPKEPQKGPDGPDRDHVLRVDVREFNSSISIDVRGLELRLGGTALLGLNGAGKSTLLRGIRSGLDAEGVPVTLVPQGARLPGNFRCRELLEYLGALRGVDRQKRKERAEELLELVALGDSASTRVSKLSGGMHQRLLVAQGLMAPEPDRVLLLDEPTVSLDERQARSVWRALGAVAAGRIAVVSSHESHQVLTEMARVVWINPGGELVGPLEGTFVRERARREGVLVADLFDRNEDDAP